MLADGDVLFVGGDEDAVHFLEEVVFYVVDEFDGSVEAGDGEQGGVERGVEFVQVILLVLRRCL